MVWMHFLAVFSTEREICANAVIYMFIECDFIEERRENTKVCFQRKKNGTSMKRLGQDSTYDLFVILRFRKTATSSRLQIFKAGP